MSESTTPHDVTRCADCGAAFPVHPLGYTGGSGYAIVAESGARVCYPCSNARERADFAKADRYDCYLSRYADGGLYLSTWPGGFLARVTACWTRPVGFGWKPKRTYFRATAPDGSAWYGTALGVGMLARARRSRRNVTGSPNPEGGFTRESNTAPNGATQEDIR